MLCGVVDKSLLYILDTIKNRTYNHPLNTIYSHPKHAIFSIFFYTKMEILVVLL
jgi:hypothetical protein